MGQFPHLYPVWVAISYGIDGLTGTRYVVTVLATLGVLSVFFAGAWLVGRPAATAGALLLAVKRCPGVVQPLPERRNPTASLRVRKHPRLLSGHCR